MSDETNTVVEVAPKEAKKAPVRKDLGDDRYVEKNEFSGGLKGFAYYSLQFKTLDAAINHFTKNEKNGADIVLGFVNSSVQYALRSRAQNKIPQDDKERYKLREKGETLAITEEDATSFMPGERDITSLSGLQKLIISKRKEHTEAKEAGNTELVESLKAEILELHKKVEALVMADL